jgi:hypothetical protein
MDWPTVTVDVHIAASPQRVWSLVSDIGLMPRFSDELQAVEWIEGGRPKRGARFIGTNSHPLIGTWSTRSHMSIARRRAFSRGRRVILKRQLRQGVSP